jgi:hypothetical protein
LATKKTYQSKRQQHANLVRWRKGRELFRTCSAQLQNEFAPDAIDKACRFIAGLPNAYSRRRCFLRYSRRSGRLTETQRAVCAILSRDTSLRWGKRAGDDSHLEGWRREKLEAKDYKAYLLSFVGDECFRALLAIEHLVSDRHYWQCLNLVWDNTKWSKRDEREWLRLLTSARPHRELLMSVDERRAWAAKPETLSVYQGYANPPQCYRKVLSEDWSMGMGEQLSRNAA